MRRLSLLALTLACGTQLSEPVRNDGYAAVMITPQIDTLDALGENRLLSVALFDAEGNDALGDAAVSWASTSPLVASIDDDGRVTAKKAGTTRIIATARGKKDTSTIVISQRVKSLVVNPTTTTLAPQATRAFSAAAYDKNNHAIDSAAVTWSSSNAGVATVNAAGVVQAQATGSATITATHGTVTGTAAVTVSTTPTPPVDSMTPPPDTIAPPIDTTVPPPVVPTAPGIVTDLSVSATSENSVTLRFTEVTDGISGAANYDVRFAAGTMSWGSASSVESGTCRTPVAGGTAGAVRTCTVTGLTPGQTYGFQLATFRGTLGVSAVFGGTSNAVTATTGGSVTPTPGPTPAPTADTIFFDDFESGSLGKWDDGVNSSKHRVVTDAGKAAAGSRYLDITYPAGDTGGWMTKFFMPGYDSLYVRYDVRVDADWTGGTKLLNLRGAPINNQWGAHGNAGSCPTGYDFFAANIVLMPEQGPGPARFYSYFPGMLPEPSGVCWGRLTGAGTVNYNDGPGFSKGVWHRVEFWVKLNSPTQANGEQRLWIDGTLRGEWTGMKLRLTDMLKLNSLTLEASLMGPTTSYARHLLVDNLLVSESRPTN